MKKIFFMSLIMAIMMPANAQENCFQEFAFRLYNKVEAKNDAPNCVMSPYSAQIALSLLANGLTEEAATELKTMMGVEDYSMQQLNSICLQSKQGMIIDPEELEYFEYMGRDKECVPHAEVANAVFLNSNLTPNSDFSEMCSTYYEGIVEKIDFADPTAGDHIDNWANEKTHGTIPQLNLPIGEETNMILANALYFNAAWMEPFHKFGAPHLFHNADGSISYVPMMRNYFSAKGAVLEEKNALVVRLPYGIKNNYHMTLFMPKDKDGEFNLNYDLWKDAQENLSTYALNIEMPLFTVDTDYELNDILRSLGATKIFEKPCVTGIADKGMNITDTKQLAHISVDENGTTASAVTEIAANEGVDGEALDYIVDRPFYFTIDHQGEILFIGHVGNLSSENVEAITNVETKPLSNNCYNLQGQRVAESHRGIVVRNGRKYINR